MASDADYGELVRQLSKRSKGYSSARSPPSRQPSTVGGDPDTHPSPHSPLLHSPRSFIIQRSPGGSGRHVDSLLDDVLHQSLLSSGTVTLETHDLHTLDLCPMEDSLPPSRVASAAQQDVDLTALYPRQVDPACQFVLKISAGQQPELPLGPLDSPPSRQLSGWCSFSKCCINCGFCYLSCSLRLLLSRPVPVPNTCAHACQRAQQRLGFGGHLTGPSHQKQMV